MLPIGMNQYVAADAVVAILRPDSAPVQRLLKAAAQQGRLLDATYGRPRRSVLRLSNGDVVLSMLEPHTIARRLEGTDADGV